MTAAEFATCRVSEDPTSPTPTWGYVMACVAFYEQGFSVPSHQFFCSQLQFYGLELHHLTPMEILHMATFMTLCEAYMGNEHHFNLWNYFFMLSYNRAQTQKRRCWALSTSSSDPSLELIPTFTFRCPTLRSGDGKYGSF
jgi:hypothetical protein